MWKPEPPAHGDSWLDTVRTAMQTVTRRSCLMKTLIRWFVASLAGLLILEGLCSVYWLVRDHADFRRSLPRARRFSEESHVRYDAEIGWVNVPGTRLPDFYGPGRTLTLNRQGFRGADLAPLAADRFRLICLGDSFTLGYGVDDADTWPARLQQLRPGLDAVNMGSGGYSIGQCCLWFRRDGLPLRPDAVILAFVSDDIWRMAGERMINGYGKPTFNLRDGRVEIGNQPVPPKIEAGRMIGERWKTIGFLGQHGGLARALVHAARAVNAVRPDPTAGDQVAIALALVQDLQAELAARGIPFALVMMPELADLTDPDTRRMSREVADRFDALARERRFPFLQLLDTFGMERSGQLGDLFNPDDPWHHYSAEGYRLVAREIDRFLAARLPRYPTP